MTIKPKWNIKEEKKILFLNPDIAAWLLVSIYVIFFSAVSVLKYNHFIYNDFDLAVHTQTLYNILHGSIYSSILGIPFLGNHLNFILFLILPVYAVFRSSITLLLLQSLALGLSGYPLYLIAKKQLSAKLSLLILFAYLFYPCIGYVNLYEFHPTVFATLFISMALYFIIQGKFKSYLIAIIMAILCQENIPLVIVFLGIYLLIIKKPIRWWLTTILAAGAFFWIGAYKLIPYFGKGTIQFISLYGYLGSNITDIIKNILIHPLQIGSIILMKENLVYMSQIFGPVSFLPFLSPVSFFAGLPTLVQHMLSLRQTEHTIYYHYTAEAIPFIFFSVISGFKKILAFAAARKNEKMIAVAFLIITVAANLILGPHIKILTDPNLFKKTDLGLIKDNFLKAIPPSAEVAATFEFLPKLANRKKLYSLHHAVMGTYTLSDRPYELPASTEYALADFEDGLTFKGNFYKENSGANLRHLFVEGDFGIVDMLDTVVLFKKGAAGKYKMYEILAAEPNIPYKYSVTVNSDIELIGSDIDRSQIQKGVVEFHFFWRCINKTKKTYGAFIDVIDSEGRIRKRVYRFICYRVYPTNEWSSGQIVEEFYRLLLPMAIPAQACSIRMGIFDYNARRIEKLSSAMPRIVKDGVFVDIAVNGD